VPTYTLSGLGGVPTTRSITINGTAQDLSADRTFNVGTVTSVAALTLGTTGTDVSSSVANGTTTPVITLNIPTASAANRGALSSADWTTFNNKQNALTNPITGSLTTNYLPKATGATTLGNSLVFDNGTNVGIGTTNPAEKFSVYGGDAVFTKFTGTGNGSFLKILNSSTTTDGTTLQASYFGSGGFGALKFEVGGSERARIFANGRFGINTGATDYGQMLQVIGASYFSDTLRVDGNVSIGSAPSTSRLLNITKNISGAVTSYGSIILSNVLSDVTNSARVFYSEVGTAAAAFTLPDLNHFFAVQGAFGAGSTVTNQYGFRVFSNLVGAGSNFGFYGDIPSGTGRWNLYMNGTAANFLSGDTQIGTGALTSEKLQVNGTMKVTGASSFGGTITTTAVDNNLTIQSTTNVSTVSFPSTNGLTYLGQVASNFIINVLGTTRFTIASTGAATFSSSVTAAGYIVGTGTTSSDVSVLFKTDTGDFSLINQRASHSFGIYDNLNTRYNLNFSSTGAATFSSTLQSNGDMIINSPNAILTANNLLISGTLRKFQVWNAVSAYIDVLNFANTGAATFASSVTVTGNLTVDTNTLFVDATNDFVGIGTTTSAGYMLDVNGGAGLLKLSRTAVRSYAFQISSGGTFTLYDINAGQDRFTIDSTGAATFSKSVTAASLVVSGTSTSSYIGQVTQTNTTAGVSFGLLVKGGTNSSDVALNVQSAASGDLFRVFGDGQVLLGVSASSIGAINLIRTGTSPVASRMTFGTDGTGYSFAIAKNQASTITDLVTISDSGAANFSSSIQAATAIAIGTAPDTNVPFKILKNINATVGIHFQNTSTSSSAFSAIQLGTDVTGATAFTNLVYASSGITESGVYKKSGTSLINTGAGGLNFLSVSQPIRFFTSTGTGTLRADINDDGVLRVANSSGTLATPAASERLNVNGGMVIDGTTLVVDAANNRVGIGTNAPTSSLNIVGSVANALTTKTANYTATESDHTILCNTTGGGFTITLPAASGCSGRIYVIKKTISNSGANNVTIDGNASETIDNSATISLQCRSSVTIQSDGSNWWILSKYEDTSCI
jgi:hypothetical protein